MHFLKKYKKMHFIQLGQSNAKCEREAIRLRNLEVKLSDRENTVAGISKKYIENNAKLMLEYCNAKQFIDAYLLDLAENVGNGISMQAYNKVKNNIMKKKTFESCMMYLSAMMLAGDGNDLKKNNAM